MIFKLLGWGTDTAFVLLVIVLSSFAFLRFNATASEDDCLRVRIWTDKHEYIPHEPILIKYEIYNGCGEYVLTNLWLLKEHFSITDNERRSYNSIFRIDCELLDTLYPGKLVVDSEYIEFGYRTFNVASYECSMEIPEDAVNPCCSYRARSNSITFSVKEPVGEERQALDLYLRADSLGRVTGLDKTTRRKNKFAAYLDLADKYPKSIYAPVSLYMALLMESVPEDKTVLISIGKRVIEDYPNTPYGARACQHLIQVYRQTSGIGGTIEYFEYLRGKYPNSEIARRAEYWLGKIKEGNF